MSETKSKKHLMVDFEPIGRRAEILPGRNLLEAARSAGVDLVSVCGGYGSCDSCRVRLMSGRLNPPTREEEEIFEPEELAAGYRLACQSVPETDVKLDVPAESLATTQRLQIEGQEVETTGTGVIDVCDLQLEPPTLKDLRSDTTRLRSALEGIGVDSIRFSLPVLNTISDVLRANNWSVRAALRGDLVVAFLSEAAQAVGLAVDVGTTKVAGYLLDLETGETLAKAGIMNPQISYGEDVVSRIAYTNAHPDGRHELQTKLIDAINQMLDGLYSEVGISALQVVEAVIVGNTAMHHLLAGLPVHQLAMAPYVPAVSEALEMPANDLGLAIAPGAMVYFPPNIAGFVGADHVAMVLSTNVWNTQQTEIALDIGTNTEITLAHNGRLLCCSCASGPAFEGAHIRDGMRAAPGAIERVQIIDGMPMVFTIGGKEPVGICGSGILDAVSELIKAGIVDERGSIEETAPRVSKPERSNHRQYLLVPAAESGHGRDIIVSRSDVNEIQLAKGAIRAGIETLFAEAGIEPGDIDRFIVAGAFGTYLDIESAVTVGMFPDLPRERFQQVGNAAGTGARQMLVSASRRAVADQIRSRIEYIELTVHPDFERRFTRALFFDRP
ncbi:MAG: ASKHA domain-containing protein [Anaerolineales bacterium]